MLESDKKDISRNLNFFGVSLSNNTSVLIIGGGKAAYIKAKSLIAKKVNVTILAKDFSEEFCSLSGLNLIKEKYYKKIIEKFHFIIIAVNDDKLREEIVADCNNIFKLYIDCTDYKNGLAIMQSQGSIEHIAYSVNTKVGVPKLSKLLLSKINDTLYEYDDFVFEVSKIRERAKKLSKEEKNIVIDFICTDDFKFFFDKGKTEQIINMFFENKI